MIKHFLFTDLCLDFNLTNELVYWNDESEWSSDCKKLEIIIPVFYNDAHRLDFIHTAKPQVISNNGSESWVIRYYGIGGTITFKRNLESTLVVAEFQTPPDNLVVNIYGGPIKYWKSTKTQGIYKPMYYEV
jgi:hypothetical protein